MIVADKVTFGYDIVPVLKDISFTIKSGDFIGIVGHNGSGKTTLIKIILGLLTQKEGKVKLFDYPSHAFNAWEKIGYLPQNLSVINPIFPATVQEVVGLGLLSSKKFPKLFSKKDQDKINTILVDLKISDLKNRLISRLSGGQLQRVMLARALVNHPELLILDEPTNAIDSDTRKTFFSYISTLNKKHQTTIILITHDIGCVGEYANKVLYLDKVALFYGSFDEFKKSEKMVDVFGKELTHFISHRH